MDVSYPFDWLWKLFERSKTVSLASDNSVSSGYDRLWIRILSSRVDNVPHSFALLTREGYYQHSNIKFVSTSGHIISST